MRKISLRLMVLVLAFLVGCGVARLFKNEERGRISITIGPPPVAVVPQSPIPANWKKISLGAFAFYGPSDLKNERARGIDSALWQFSNDKMLLSIDYGMYANPLTSYSSQLNYEERWSQINGRRAKIISFRSYRKEWWYAAAAYFPPPTSGGRELSVWASCADTQTQEDAMRVLNSIEFK